MTKSKMFKRLLMWLSRDNNLFGLWLVIMSICTVIFTLLVVDSSLVIVYVISWSLLVGGGVTTLILGPLHNAIRKASRR